MRTLRVIDLCAGTGSATQAFINRGHEVLKIDCKPFVGIDIVADVNYPRLEIGGMLNAPDGGL